MALSGIAELVAPLPMSLLSHMALAKAGGTMSKHALINFAATARCGHCKQEKDVERPVDGKMRLVTHVTKPDGEATGWCLGSGQEVMP